MIRISSSEEFKRLFDALATDIVGANIHWRLYRDLHAALGEHRLVWAQSQTFWHLTLNAHTFAAIQQLCRAYDQNQTALHLLSWLKTIQANLHLFEVVEFKKRLSGNTFVDSLAEYPRMPDATTLEQDIRLCSAADPQVRLLLQHRGNLFAHRNARTTAAGRSLSEEFAIPAEDLEALLLRAHTILNRYSSLFIATSHSKAMLNKWFMQFLDPCKSITCKG
jgi:hypothetical protein